MSASLEPAVTTVSESLRALERAVDDSRAHWNDAARNAFDRRYGEPILMDGKRTHAELKRLANELTAAIRDLDRAG